MRPDSGFTLLEVLIAFAIAALALAALTASAGHGLRASHVASDTDQALSRARSRLDAASRAPELGDRTGDDGGGFRWQEHVRALERNGPATLYDLAVVITWRGDGGERHVALHTRRLSPGS